MIPDTYVLNDVIYRTLENGAADAAGTLLTNMFSIQEIVDSMNRVQQEFLLDTGAVGKRTTIPGIAGTSQYATPVDSIRPRRITWQDTSDSVIRSLTLDETWGLDHGSPGWPQDQDIPISWRENTNPQQTFSLALTPINNGTIGLLYIALATTLTGAGIAFTVPDDWTPYLLWGTLAELLSSDGPSFDPVRAQYCSRRYDEGVELARLVLGGK